MVLKEINTKIKIIHTCDNFYMTPVALLQDRAGAGPNDPTSSRFLELNSTYVIVRLTSSINSSVLV